jgi:SAM-dependent methyltransferase
MLEISRRGNWTSSMGPGRGGMYGIDLTDAAVQITRSHLEMYGRQSELLRADAERLPDGSFDLVYSWGWIHYSVDPAQVIREIKRVLKPGGLFVGMMYGRRSLKVLKAWHAAAPKSLMQIYSWRLGLVHCYSRAGLIRAGSTCSVLILKADGNKIHEDRAESTAYRISRIAGPFIQGIGLARLEKMEAESF